MDNCSELKAYSAPCREDYRSKKEEVLSRFRKEFIEGRYMYDPVTHAVVEMLVRNSDPYQIIEQLIEDRLKLVKSFEEEIQKLQAHG